MGANPRNFTDELLASVLPLKGAISVALLRAIGLRCNCC
jgi:hypothetical protein